MEKIFDGQKIYRCNYCEFCEKLALPNDKYVTICNMTGYYLKFPYEIPDNCTLQDFNECKDD